MRPRSHQSPASITGAHHGFGQVSFLGTSFQSFDTPDTFEPLFLPHLQLIGAFSTASFPPEPIQHPPEGAAAKKSDQKRRQNEEIQATDDHSTRKTKRAKLKTYSIKTKASPKKELKVGTWTVGKPESGDMRTLSVYAYLDRRRYIHLRCCDSDKSKLGFEWDGSPKWETILLNPDLSSVPLQEAKDRIKNRLKNGDGEAEGKLPEFVNSQTTYILIINSH